MQKVIDVSSLAALDEAVSQIRASSDKETATVVYLHGDLGTGKTTFAQHWLRQVGVTGAIPSPTYNIVNEYHTSCGLMIHADLYRINDPEELMYLDVREWSARAKVVLIEWPEQGEGYIPEADMTCSFTLTGDTRQLLWQTSQLEAS